MKRKIIFSYHFSLTTTERPVGLVANGTHDCDLVPNYFVPFFSTRGTYLNIASSDKSYIRTFTLKDIPKYLYLLNKLTQLFLLYYIICGEGQYLWGVK